MKKGIKSRISAILSLDKIYYSHWDSADAVDTFSQKYALDDRSRTFALEIIFGVLKNLKFLDYILKNFLATGKYPSKKCAMAIRAGAFQIAFMNVPDYAAVFSTVEALKSLKRHKREISLANAVLRKFAEKWKDVKFPDDSVKKLSLKYSHPEWLVKRWLGRFGEDFTEKFLAANNENPPKYFRINILKISPKNFIAQMERESYSFQRTIFSEYFELRDRISAANFKPFREGLVSVQDCAFAIPVKVLSPCADERILEIGAAPGGKTAQIAEILQGDVENFFAIDIIHKRNNLIVQNFRRLGINIPNIITGNGKKSPFRNGMFHKILIDAPCSSLGVLRRHPEIRWRRHERDLKKFAKIQMRMIYEASRLLKSGGMLVFSTCTTEPEENEYAVKTIIALGMKILKIQNSTIPEKFLGDGGRVIRTFPHRDNLDGSFTVVARK